VSAIQSLKTAGFRVTEVSQLMKVSRPTASNWYRGAHTPHTLVEGKLNKLVDAVRRATEAGELPIPPTVIGKVARWAYINEVIARYLARKQTEQ
jgi:hypothetical protein